MPAVASDDLAATYAERLAERFGSRARGEQRPPSDYDLMVGSAERFVDAMVAFLEQQGFRT